MTVFWSLAAIMVMVALLFILPPLLRNRETTGLSRDEINTGVVREQLSELEADLASGKLGQDQYDAARHDLEQELLYDLGSGSDGEHPARIRNGRWLAWLLVPAISLTAIMLYQLMGSVELIDRLQQPGVSTAQPQPAQAPGSLEDMVAGLSARLQQQPDDLKGWVMLARSYTVMERYPEAASAYANVLRLGGETPELLTDYADALAMANNGDFDDTSGAVLLKALELDPDNLKGLWLAGHWKYQQGEGQAALDYWQRAAAKLPPGSRDARVIAGQISGLQAELGIAADPAPAPTIAADRKTKAASLSVHVSLAPDLAAKAGPGDTVFIFARATQGPRMPLAIVRKQVRDLPLTVTLDDTLAMTPQVLLSNFEQVTVGARVSPGGNAMPASGDLQGSVSPVDTDTRDTIELTIDSRVP